MSLQMRSAFFPVEIKQKERLRLREERSEGGGDRERKWLTLEQMCERVAEARQTGPAGGQEGDRRGTSRRSSQSDRLERGLGCAINSLQHNREAKTTHINKLKEKNISREKEREKEREREGER